MNSAVERYMSALDDYRVEDALNEFAETAIYMKPKVLADGSMPGGLDLIEGRDQLRDFVEQRGKRSIKHVIRSAIRHENHEFLEGILAANDGTPLLAFASSAIIDDQGKILRYLTLANSVDEACAAVLDRPPAVPIRDLLGGG